MHRGAAGAGVLNTLLQEALTPASPDVPERRFGGRIFRVGDKVTQIRNNYDKGTHGVFNGTQGVVTGMDLVDQTLTVRTDEDEDIDYQFSELDELTHAYAVSIHRSQGSEYPCVVIPITTSAWMMLQRNLLYTAVPGPRNSSCWSAPKMPSAKLFALSAPDAVTPPWATASANGSLRPPEAAEGHPPSDVGFS
jgi:ATP-dependent exoDNAse (exonuclease V) alpha subunit